MNDRSELNRDKERDDFRHLKPGIVLKEYEVCFRDKTILVTGGTGSFGHQVVSMLLPFHPGRIIVFSRDEKKQLDMQRDYDFLDKLQFIVGDVRDYNAILDATRGVDIIYHAAALKQVPNCENYPFEAVMTNILGAQNVRRAAETNHVEAVIAVSTDKAVKPVNVMGMTKAVQERIILNPNLNRSKTRFMCVRYGNVVGSRGSVIPFFRERLREGKSLPVTHSEMTRFLLTLEDAVGLVLYATLHGQGSDLFVRKMPACFVLDLAKVMAEEISKKPDYPIEIVGVRAGEKIHEVLVSEEEMLRAVESDSYYTVYSQGVDIKPQLLRDLREYRSNNTEMLNARQIKELLQKDGWL